MRFEPNINKLGHRLNQNVHMVFENCRVPEENAFAVGNGDLVISKAFTWSGPGGGNRGHGPRDAVPTSTRCSGPRPTPPEATNRSSTTKRSATCWPTRRCASRPAAT